MDDANVINFPKLCECGCGQPTPIAKQHDKRAGTIKGQPTQFLRGHNRTIKRPAPTTTDEGIIIHLTKGYECLVSPEDADLSTFNWHVINDINLYPVRYSHNGRLRLHRVILERKLGRPLQPDEQGDHINGNPLDNRRENLRKATQEQNKQNRKKQTNNTSGFRGVCYNKANNRWQATVQARGNITYLGIFDTPEEASAAYERAATELFGEFKREA